jgi:hypothetical protein
MELREKPQYSVVLFPSVSHALRAEKVLQRAGLVVKLIPVPRQLSSDCGVCLRFDRIDNEKVRHALQLAGMETEGIHDI